MPELQNNCKVAHVRSINVNEIVILMEERDEMEGGKKEGDDREREGRGRRERREGGRERGRGQGEEGRKGGGRREGGKEGIIHLPSDHHRRQSPLHW